MTKPDILTAIDDLLEENQPENIRATAEGDKLSAVQDFLGQPGQRMTDYRGVRISRSLAQIVDGGFALRVE